MTIMNETRLHHRLHSAKLQSNVVFAILVSKSRDSQVSFTIRIQRKSANHPNQVIGQRQQLQQVELRQADWDGDDRQVKWSKEESAEQFETHSSWRA